MSKKAKIILFIVLGVILLPILCGFIRVAVYLQTLDSAPDESLTHYKSTKCDGWLAAEPYAVFPEKADVEASKEYHYLHKRIVSPTILQNNDIVTFLSCQYSDEAYSEEVARLNMLCGDLNINDFQYPAYVRYAGFPSHCYQYALLDESANTIYYVSFQYEMALKKYVDRCYWPIISHPLLDR